jgi:hypothetical protein
MLIHRHCRQVAIADETGIAGDRYYRAGALGRFARQAESSLAAQHDVGIGALWDRCDQERRATIHNLRRRIARAEPLAVRRADLPQHAGRRGGHRRRPQQADTAGFGLDAGAGLCSVTCDSVQRPIEVGEAEPNLVRTLDRVRDVIPARIDRHAMRCGLEFCLNGSQLPSQ